MVSKVIKISLFLAVAIFCAITGFCLNKGMESDFIKSALPSQVVENSNILPLSKITSSYITVIFEGKNEEESLNLKEEFMESLDKNEVFDLTSEYFPLFEEYLKTPSVLLSESSKKLIKSGDYEKLYERAVEKLYAPMPNFGVSFEDDPYFLLADYTENLNTKDEVKNIDGKYYSSLNLKLKNPKDKKFIKKLTAKKEGIYFSGVPAHSFYTEQNASRSINIIFVLITLLTFFVTYFYFRSFKILLLISACVSFGFLTGFVATRLWFGEFHLLTFLFEATLIGIGLDYSYHYLSAGDENKNVRKNLFLSFLTTAMAFLVLYFSKIEILKQISIFSITGLFSIFLFVILLYPYVNFQKKHIFKINLPKKAALFPAIFIIFLFIVSFFRQTSDFSLKSAYLPQSELQFAERINSKLQNSKGNTFITVEGENLEKLLENEEKIGEILNKNGIEYFSISKFLPSEKKQKENFDLVKKLYFENLDNFNGILSENGIKKLKNLPFKKLNQKPFTEAFKDYLIKPCLSVMAVKAENIPHIEGSFYKIENYQKTISDIWISRSHFLLYAMPFLFIFLIVILSCFLNLKQALKITVPPLIAVILTPYLLWYFRHPISFFVIISLYLVLGLTFDYSIFRAQDEKNCSEDGINISFLTTASSFLLLSFVPFELVSSMGAALFLGVSISYLFGLLFKGNKGNV